MTDNEIMTMGECAEYLRVSYRTVQNLIRTGRIPYYKLGKSKRFRKSRVDEALLATERKGHYIN